MTRRLTQGRADRGADRGQVGEVAERPGRRRGRLDESGQEVVGDEVPMTREKTALIDYPRVGQTETQGVVRQAAR